MVLLVDIWVQVYGYYEIIVCIFEGKGYWLVFWLVFVGIGWLFEIDIFEVYSWGVGGCLILNDDKFLVVLFFDWLDLQGNLMQVVDFINFFDLDVDGNFVVFMVKIY